MRAGPAQLRHVLAHRPGKYECFRVGFGRRAAELAAGPAPFGSPESFEAAKTGDCHLFLESSEELAGCVLQGNPTCPPKANKVLLVENPDRSL